MDTITTTDPLSQRFERSAPRVVKAAGPWLTTKDGRRLVDYLLGSCVHVLGHSDPYVVAAIREQAGRAVNVSDATHELIESVATRILAHAQKDALRFVNSGSEAVHLAIRLARAHTGRSRLLKFDGHYHGWLSEQIARFVPGSYSTGLPPGAGDALISVPWNDADRLLEAFDEEGDELAAVLCEPLLCHAGPIEPRDGFLALLRSKCDAHGALLIFDECITGFRVALGGAQQRYRVNADLVTYSKALSAGLPFGVCCGTFEVMGRLGVDGVYQAGTYDANPLSLAAVSAVLDRLEGTDALERIAAATDRLVAATEAQLDARAIPHVRHQAPGMTQFYFTHEERIETPEAVLTRTDLERYRQLVDSLRRHGVYIVAGDLRADPCRSWLSQWFVSAAHDDDAIARTAEALGHALDDTGSAGLGP